jgi:hypothetical protein
MLLRRLLLVTLGLVGLLAAVWIESATYWVRGSLWGEAFYQGLPTSYWRNELDQWERDPWDTLAWSRKDYSWFCLFFDAPPLVPPLLGGGDPDARAVLYELGRDDRAHIRGLAIIGLARLNRHLR